MPPRAWANVLVAVGAVALAGCEPDGSSGASSSSSSAGTAASASAAPAGGRPGELRKAESSRRADLVLPTDLSARDVAVRRAAGRALARIGGEAVRPGLLRALSDADEQVVAWAAYGLGQICAGHAEPSVRALVAASARFTPTGREADDSSESESKQRLVAWRAIARAVGRCKAPSSEATLLAWTRHGLEHGTAAVYGLGDLAAAQRRLREETFVALLTLAAGDAKRPPLPAALYPFGRVAHLPPSVIERTREVAKARLEQPGSARLHAINALSRTDEAAAAILSDVVRRSDDFSAAERAQAARGLKQLGSAGRRALGELLADLMPATGAVEATTLIGDEFGVLWTVLSALDSEGKSGQRLRRLASLPAAAALPRSIRLRVSLLRCTAAQLIAERDYTSSLLTGCDVTELRQDGDAGKAPLPPLAARAVVAALGTPGVKMRGARLKAWQPFARSEDPSVRAAAIALIGDHSEIDDASAVLADGLLSDSPGVVAAAAKVIAKVPARASKGKSKKPAGDGKTKASAADPAVVAALLQRLSGEGPTEDLEAMAAVIDAAGALVLDAARPQLRALCRSPRETIRNHAKAALRTVLGGGEAVRCDPAEGGLELPDELGSLLTGVTTLKFETDAGALEIDLDPAFAPVAVTRMVELARGGYYDDLVVHRVEPGFVVQFGSPTADGFGGSDRPALACETSPLSFNEATVGVALAGRDTGNSQLFVTLARVPHLDGQYAWLGTARGPWSSLAPGDVIRKVKVAK